MRIILTLLPLFSLIDGKGGVGGGRGASGARGASAASGARGASSASRGASASASRPSGSYSAPRVINTPVRSPSRSSFSGSSALLGFGAGALAGSLTANRINNAYAPVSYGGNNYYWSRDVVPQDAPNVCSRPLTDIDDPALEDVMFQDGTSPSEFAWMCSSSEMCCEWSCCEDNGRSSIAVARRSFSDPTDSTDDSTLTPPSSLSSDSTTDTNNEDFVIPVEEGIVQEDSIYSEEYSYRGSIAGWIILGISIAALILIIGCIGVFTVKRRRKAAQLSRQRRVVQQSELPRDDPWTPNLPPSHRTPPVFTSPSVQGVPPSYSNIVHAAPMSKSTLPEKPPAYSTQ